MRKLRMFHVCAALSLLVLPAAALAVDFIAAPLSGGEEVPANDSRARGTATFTLSADGTELHYKLIVANIENVVAAHIHCCAPVGVNAGIVAFLAGNFPAGGGRSDGVLAEGTITVANVIGVLAGDFDALILAMQAGNTYVNVHTNDGVAPPNTGPGDLPGGEIRAQIRPN